jgi:hypothetical protein
VEREKSGRRRRRGGGKRERIKEILTREQRKEGGEGQGNAGEGWG